LVSRDLGPANLAADLSSAPRVKRILRVCDSLDSSGHDNCDLSWSRSYVLSESTSPSPDRPIRLDFSSVARLLASMFRVLSEPSDGLADRRRDRISLTIISTLLDARFSRSSLVDSYSSIRRESDDGNPGAFTGSLRFTAANASLPNASRSDFTVAERLNGSIDREILERTSEARRDALIASLIAAPDRDRLAVDLRDWIVRMSRSLSAPAGLLSSWPNRYGRLPRACSNRLVACSTSRCDEQRYSRHFRTTPLRMK